MGTLEPYPTSPRVLRRDDDGFPLHIVYGRTMDTQDELIESPDMRAMRVKRIGSHRFAYETKSVNDLQPMMTSLPKAIRKGAAIYMLATRMLLMTLVTVILCVLGIHLLVWVW